MSNDDPAELELTPDDVRFERMERKFQRDINHRRYLTWKNLQRKVKPHHRYRVEMYGLPPQAMNGTNLLHEAANAMRNRSCTFVETATKVEDEYEVPIRERWTTKPDPVTGQEIPIYEDDIWYTEALTGGGPAKLNAEAVAFTERTSMQPQLIAAWAAETRQRETGIHHPQAAEAATEEARQAVAKTMNEGAGAGRENSHVTLTAAMMATEAFDRAFGRERIRLAGVDLDQHPEWRFYAAFYEQGLPPPTHAEAADHIIKLFARTREPEDSRARASEDAT